MTTRIGVNTYLIPEMLDDRDASPSLELDVLEVSQLLSGSDASFRNQRTHITDMDLMLLLSIGLE